MATSGTPPSLGDCQEAVQRLLQAEATLAEVEGAIDETDLTDDEKAGLWLLGWSLTELPTTTHNELQQRLTAAG